MSAHEAFRRALEEAEKVCEQIEASSWDQYKREHSEHNDGRHAGAFWCLRAIRAIPNPYPAPTPPEEKP